MANHDVIEDKVSVTRYYNNSQTRIDDWNRLKDALTRVVNNTRTGNPTQKHIQRVGQLLENLLPVSTYWAFPGPHICEHLRTLFLAGRYNALNRIIRRIVRALMSDSYRQYHAQLDLENDDQDHAHGERENNEQENNGHRKHYFEVLVVDHLNAADEERERKHLREIRRDNDAFVYEPVFVKSFEDAVIASLMNYNLQAVVIRYDFPLRYRNGLFIPPDAFTKLTGLDFDNIDDTQIAPLLAHTIRQLRPSLDIYLVTDQSVEEVASLVTDSCRRVFYNREDYLELHLNILRGVRSRYKTPFFSALKEYSQQPTGVFHAMPISRGKSLIKSNWIQDMQEFYGLNTFLAETSATSGGLDSLLEPTGPIKDAQAQAARAFGARQTFFATNGTSTCNKIVVQALVRPGDIVLVDRDCHKSHHYGLVLAGAEVVYLDSYPLSDYSMYGAVPLREIKSALLGLKANGQLSRVKMLLLTNCTFDGLVYNVERIMQNCLAIKPDLIFLWDEAWFAFARFDPTYRRRTGMYCAQKLRDRYRSANYQTLYENYPENLAALDNTDKKTLLDNDLMPDPTQVRIRVYTTQSTHKTLTALRQGSMLHIYDQDYRSKVEEAFREAYMTHTSTSPNYQILASLDLGRRQVELEGYELVQKQIEMAMVLRKQIRQHPLLNRYFKVLDESNMIPAKFRDSIDEQGEAFSWEGTWQAWQQDEFVLDSSRITLYVADIGVDGDTFKNQYLMDRYGIQVNKTSRNTVLFMTNIGTTRSSVAYLIEVLTEIAMDMNERLEHASSSEHRVHQRKVHSLRTELPELPDFSFFHDAFRKNSNSPAGDIRRAFYLAYDDDNCEYLEMPSEVDKIMATERQLVSASFITPYPPGFPILVPGQVVSEAILDFMRKLDVKEIHGYRAELGLRVFKQKALTMDS